MYLIGPYISSSLNTLYAINTTSLFIQKQRDEPSEKSNRFAIESLSFTLARPFKIKVVSERVKRLRLSF